MPEAKTEVVSLDVSAIPWDSQYNISPFIINMVTDINARLLSVPVNKTLYIFTDFSFTPASENVTILAIMRASKSQGTYNSDFRINQFVSDYAVITTEYQPLTWTPLMGLSTITIFKIDELNHIVLDVLSLTNTTDGTPLLNPNFMNRGDFSYAQNSSDQCAFIDDNAQVWYFQVNSAITTGARLLTYNGARVEYIGAGSPQQWRILGEVGTPPFAAGIDGIAITDITATIDYRTLLDLIPDNKQLIVVLQNYGIIYTANQNLFYFTEAGDFSKILFQFEKWPKYNGRSDLPYDPLNWNDPGQLGIPVTYPAPGRVIDMVGINSSMYVFTQDNIQRLNLVIVNNNPTLQPDTTFNMQYKIRLNSNAIVYQNAMYFTTEDDKVYVLTTKGIITELTNRLLPDKYNFIYNQFFVNENAQNFYPSRILLPVKLFNMNCIIENYSLLNLDTGNFSFLISNQNLKFAWEPTPGVECGYDQPKRITASTDTGRYIGLQNVFQYIPTDFDNSISNSDTNFDYFSDGLVAFKPYEFPGKNKGTLAGISIDFTDSNFDPALFQTFEAITLGVYILVDNIYSFDLINNLRDDTWWEQYDKTFNRTHSINIYATQLNIRCQSFIAVLRFSKFTPVSSVTPQFYLQKFAAKNIMFNLMQ